MGFNLGMACSGCIYIVLVTMMYFNKKRISTYENKIYGHLLLVSVLQIIMGLLGFITIYYYPNALLIKRIINVAYLFSLICWALIFTLYVISISFNNKQNKKIDFIIFALFLIVFLIISALPLGYYNINNFVYTSGSAVSFTYFMSFLCILTIIFCVIKNRKNLLSKKYIPVASFFLIGIVALIFQINNPKLFLISPMEMIVTIIMYFTIENPDVKMLTEVYRAKEISDNANEEKTMFLFNVTKEIKTVTNSINSHTDTILEETSNKNINVAVVNDNAMEIKSDIAQFNTMTNELLDISSIDAANIKVYNTKYNIKLILKQIITTYKDKCNNIEFRSNIASDLPEYMYGDSINLKKILISLLDNAIKYTNNGYVELNVSCVKKQDICRLIISIEDSGIGIKSEELDKVFNKNKEGLNRDNLKNNLYTIKKILTIMGGAIITNSTYGKGTTMKVILDQKIVPDEFSPELKLYNNKKILLIDSNENTYKIFKKILHSDNINIDYVGVGKLGLDKIREKEKYDLVFIEDDLKPIDGYEIIKKLNNIKTFNSPVVLLTKDSNIQYSDDYKKYGFKNYLLKPIKKKDLFEIIDTLTSDK
ncbi:his Kinase A (Phosphoacceptor) domain./Histidine kinase-DNA gyrase B-and HSP90-like ATPase./Response regulator receiver domain [Clostridium sp. CAG:914]|nr:his Kinase A (Phosphoacceptor) domain./Histidine kinase-DNA gyrase B-and HSP90-like ATPase./Response regulator receiver domain [Clostridium sp. CAG:914]